MRAVVTAQHLKMTASLMVRVSQALMVEPQATVAVHMMEALVAVGPTVEGQQEMRVPSRSVLTMKVGNPAVRLRDQTLKAAEAPPSLTMRKTSLRQSLQ